MKKLIFVLLLWNTAVNAQSIPRDTSFTLQSAYAKAVKDYPFIKMVKPSSPAGVNMESDVVYSAIGNRKMMLDVIAPAGEAKNKRPAVLMLFGGGWKSGDKSHSVPLAEQLALKGYVTILPEYRLSLEAKYPAALHDVKAAVRWIRANAGKYHIDTNRIAALGVSAGGQLVALAGATNGDEQFDGDGGYQNHSSTINAVIDIDGILAFKHPESEEGKSAAEWLGGTYEQVPTVWQEASALTHAGKSMPPILFINSSNPRFHAGRDDLIKRLDSLGIYSEVYTFPNTPHPFWFFDPWFQPTVDYVVSFLQRVFK
jgi:pectinesterase